MRSSFAKGTYFVAGVLVAVAVVAAVAIGAWDHDGSRATAIQTDTTRTINVSGEGIVSVTPDVAVLNLGVNIRDPQLATAQSNATTAMNSVRDALKRAGIADKDVQTTNYSVYVEQDYNQPNQPIIGYNVTQMVTVKVREIGKAGEVIQTAVDAGANQVNGIWFTLEDTSSAVRQARELAVTDARSRAEHLASLSNATLGSVLTISEGTSASGAPMPYPAAAAEKGGGAPSLDPGTLQVVVTVSVSYVMQ